MRRIKMQRLFLVTAGFVLAALALGSTEASAQIVFRETFGSANAQLPTATSTADGNWVSATCQNGLIVSTGGDSPSDDGPGSTHYLRHNTGSCTYTSNQAVWRNVTPIAVQPNTTYTFSYRARATNLTSPPGLNQLVTPNAGSITVHSTVTPALTTTSWVLRSVTFTTSLTTTSVTLRIRNTVIVAGGNDFGLDDIILQQVPAFPGCTPTPYLAQGSPSTLYRVNTATNPFTFPVVGSEATAPFAYNAAGFNPADNYIYVIEVGTNEMTRVGADGAVYTLGAITGLPVGSYPGGVIAPDGSWYVLSSGTNTLYRVNIATRTATAITASTTFAVGGDVAWYNGALYGASNNVLYSITFPTPTTATVTPVGPYVGPTAFGAMIGASNGVFGVANDGGFYQFDPLTGAATLISGTPFTSGNNDAAKCESAPFLFASDLGVTKTDNRTTYVAGQNVAYTIVVSNAGPFGAAGVIVNDPLPTGITTASWTCTNGANGGACDTASGTGGISGALVSLPVNANVTFTVTMAVPAGFTGNLVNTVTITPPSTTSDTNSANDTATDTDTPATADLAITKSDGQTVYAAGDSVVYTIVVRNNGPHAVTNAQVIDALPAGITAASWTCGTPTGGGTCGAASGTGAINTTANLPVNATVTYTLTLAVPTTFSGDLANTGSVSAPGVVDPTPTNNSETDTDTQLPTFGACDSSLFLAQGNPTQLSQFDTSTNPFVFNAVGGAAPVGYNAIAFNPIDNYMYGMVINSNILVRVGGDGTVVQLGPIANVPNVNINAGEIGPDGTYYIKAAGLNAQLYKVNLATRSATLQTLTTAVATSDLGWFNGQLYGDSPGAPLVAIDPSTGQVTTIGPSGAAAGDAFDAMFGGSNGLWGSTNTGGFYQFDVTPGATARGTLIAGSPASGNNDGAKCVNSPLTFPADLSILKDDGQLTYTPGQAVSYTITASNAGPFGVSGAIVNDPLPAGIPSATWTCGNGANGGACSTASGSGSITNSLVNLPVGASVQFLLSFTVPAGFTGDLVNTATVTAPSTTTDANTANDSATDIDRRLSADLTITKSSTPNPYVAGEPFTYTIVATNLGPDPVTGATVNDNLPSALAGFTWSCTAAGTGATCGSAGGTLGATPVISTTVNLPVGGTATFSINGALPLSTGGTLTNTATIAAPAAVLDPVPGNNSDTDVNPAGPQADLRISKVSSPNPYVPGQTLTYTVVVSNAGPDPVTGARVQDAWPAPFASFTWTCASGGGGSSCPASGSGDVDALVDLPVGTSVTFTGSGLVPPSLTGQVTNTATVAAPLSVVDPVPGNNTAQDVNPSNAKADLAITKTGPASYTPGGSITYTIVVTNNGPSDAPNARVQDAPPSSLTGVTWSCTVPGGSGGTCNTASGSGTIDALVSLPSGQSVEFTMSGNVPATQSGVLSNTATVAAPSGVTDPNLGNNSSTTNSGAAPEADLQIVKSVAPPGTYTPGTTLTYTIAVTNVGPSAVTAARVQDTFPAPMSGFTWTCTDGAGGTCGTASGSGVIDALVSLLPVGSVTFTASGIVPLSTTTVETNTATVTPPAGTNDPTPGNNTSSVTSTPTYADLSIAKVDGADPVNAASPITYTLTVTNAGASAATNVVVLDPLPLGTSFISAAGLGWSCGFGGGNIQCSRPTLAIGPAPDITVTLRAPNEAGTVTNNATVDADEVDPNLADNIDSEPTTVNPHADLAVTKVSTPNPYVPGTPFTYTIVVSNLGPSTAIDAIVTDSFPPALATFTWGCAGNGGGVCDTGSGSGAGINTTVDLPSGGSVTFTVTGTMPSDTQGTLTNTAVVTPPATTPDPVPGNNNSTDVNQAGPIADLQITKTSAPNPYVPGQPLTYTIVVSNVGPSDAIGARVQDAWPAPFAGFTWTCGNTTGGATCVTATGAGDIDALVNLPVNGTATFTATGTVGSGVTGTTINTATIAPPSTVTDPVPGNNTDSDQNPTGAQADLSITKTQSPNPYVPGTSLTYTLVVSNSGPSDAPFSRVQDTLPSSLTNVSWTCAPTTGGAVCHTPSGATLVDAMVSLPAGASTTFTITATVPSSVTGTLTNTATVTAPSTVTDANPSNNSATVGSTGMTTADLAIVKTAAPEPYQPGTTVTYTITVSNAGPSDAIGALVQDTFPAPMSGFTWTCGSSGGATCDSPSGTGSIGVLVDMPVGSTITFVASGVPAATTTPVTNTATVDPPAGVTDANLANNTSSAPSTPILADVSIVKTDAADPVDAGEPIVYTLTVANAGPFPATNVTVSDPMPAGTTFLSASGAGWACGESGGVIGCTLPSLASGGNSAITVTLQAPTDAGTITNTATVSASEVDPNPANNTSSQPTSVLPRADLAITKVSTPNPYVPGTAYSYTIVVSNLGPSNVTGASVTDTLPSAVASFDWTCTPNTTNAVCGAATGNGSIDTTVDLPSGGSVTFVVSGTLASGTTDVLTNTATVTPPAGVTDPVTANNTDTDVNPAEFVADLRISKASTPNPYVPGEPLAYTLVVTNAGPSDALGARVRDPLASAFAGFTWTCAASAGAVCTTPSGTGDVDALVDLPVGSTATFTSTGTVPSSHASVASNTATITPPADVHDPVPGNNVATAQNPPGPEVDLVITKAQTPDPYVPGAGIIYTLLVQNLGPSDAVNARVQDMLPGVITGATWSCAASGAGAACASANGVNVVDALVTLPAGTSATFTITGTVLPNATGVLSNTATVMAPVDVTDPVPGNNTSTVNSGGAPQADLAIVKSATPNPYVAGTPLTFTIVASNSGPSDAPNARVQDLFPPSLSGFTWTCAPSAAAATCGAASGMSLIDVLVNLPVNAAVTFTVTGTVPPETTGPLTNTATVEPPIGVNDPQPANNLSSVTLGANARADLSLTKTSTPNPYVPGSPVTYSIVASNAGPSALLGGRVRDGLPAALQNVTWTCSASNGTCPGPNGSGNVDALVDIAPGGTVTFTITADVPEGTSGTLVNAATIVPPAGVVDTTPNNNSAVNYNPSIPVPGPADLKITQEFPGVAPPNGLLTFRLRTQNLGSNTALNPYITGLIPPGTTFVSATPSDGGFCNTPGNPPAPDPVTGYPIPGAATEPMRCTWPGLMKPGESHVVEFTVRVAPGTPQGQILWSCFWTWSETDDPYHANNVVDAYLFVDDGMSPVGDLAIQAGALSEGVVGTTLPTRVGAAVPMRFWATNNGPAATRGQYALILDTVNTIQIVDVKLPQGWVSPSGPSSAVWDTGVVQPGQTVALDLTVRVLTPGAMELFAQRITGSPGDPNASNERATIVLDGYAPGFAGRWVAVGNVDGAGAGEIVTGAGQGETPQVRVFTGAGADTGLRFFAYERPFAGGVQIASCDVNGDGMSELITAPGPGRAPTIRVLSLLGGVVTELIAFDAFEAGFTGGASVACADLDADGAAEVVVGAGPGRAPEVQVYNVGLSSITQRATFLAYEAGFLGGVRVAAGAYPGRAGWLDAFAIATTPGAGRAPELRLWTETGAPVAQVVVSSATNGVLPTLGDVNGDGHLDLLLAPDDGRPELVRIFEVDSGEVLGDVEGGSPAFPVGIRTAVGLLEGGPGQPEIVIGNGPGGHPRVRVIYWPPAGPVQRLEILPLEIP